MAIKSKRDGGRNRQGARRVLPVQEPPKGPIRRRDRTESLSTKVSIKK